MMPRLQYGSVESKPLHVARNVPPSLNGSAFQTLRYRKHGPPLAKRLYGAGKTIIDVSQVENTHIKAQNPHRPVSTCTNEVFMNPKESPLVVRHYLGSFERFLFRDDARAQEYGPDNGMKSRKESLCSVKLKLDALCTSEMCGLHQALLFHRRTTRRRT